MIASMTLNQRITISAGIVLLIFISLISLALNDAYRESSDTALKKQLTSQLFVLMAAAEVDAGNVRLPTEELDSLLGLPSSGLYAYVVDSEGDILWRSSSTLDADPPEPVIMTAGDGYFADASIDDTFFLIHAYGVNWVYESGEGEEELELTFNIVIDLQDHMKQISDYSMTLWRWLAGMSLLLIIVQAAILHWGLSPLRQVSKEIAMIENGTREKIERDYPIEISLLTDNINTLISQERSQKLRYRNSLGDLAHSMKTPLAVIQSYIDRSGDSDIDSLRQPLEQVNQTIEYQLQRAATAGKSRTGKPLVLQSLLQRLVTSLDKVYRDKGLSIDIVIDDTSTLRADQGDMLELFGNLLDNACKWAASKIVIDHTVEGSRHRITISDDGPGIDPDIAEQLMLRGIRADQAIAGHGIGLSIVQDIIEAYDGKIEISKSPYGGASVSVIL